MPAPDLDHWIAGPQVRIAHQRTAAAGAGELWDAAQTLRLDETRTLGRLVRWRIPGVPARRSFSEMLAGAPFTVLDSGEHWSLSGLCGRIWTLARDYPRLAGPDEFRGWSQPHTVRVLFAHWVEPAGEGRSIIHSEARVAPTDRLAAFRLRSLWLVVSPFERLIGAEALALAVRHAEGR